MVAKKVTFQNSCHNVGTRQIVFQTIRVPPMITDKNKNSTERNPKRLIRFFGSSGDPKSGPDPLAQDLRRHKHLI